MFRVKIVVGFESVVAVCKFCVKVLVNLLDFMIVIITVIKFIVYVQYIYCVFFML